MNQPRCPLPTHSDPQPEGVPWTVLRLVTWSTAYLEKKGVPAARLDVEHLLAHTLGMDRLNLYLEFDRPVTPEELSRFKPLLLARAQRRPLQYILGRTSFRELTLSVDPRVLIPRPETEELVGAVLERVDKEGAHGLRALDVGTGSGAIALSLAREGSFRLVVATDTSEEALEVARANTRSEGLEDTVEFRFGAVLTALQPGERFHVLVSNPPYVSEEDFQDLEAEVRDWEPREALVADEGGLSMLYELVAGAPKALERGGLLALEVGAGQASAVAERIRGTCGFGTSVILRDLGRVERMVLAIWNGFAEFSQTGSPRETLVTTESF